MDGSRFDALTRLLSIAGSRRRLIAGLAAGAFGLVGAERAEAVACRTPGSLCRENANCCSGVCGPKDRTGRRTCRCRTGADCAAAGASPQRLCADGLCVACPSGDVCAGGVCPPGDVCAGGACTCTADAAPARPPCGADPACCACLITAGCGPACANHAINCTSDLCSDFQNCPNGDECPPDHVCAFEICGAGNRNLCFPRCGVPFQAVETSVGAQAAGDEDRRIGAA
ncbi:MAG TPA: hypothetical protein VH482_25725 [Thermomicrobiales bacterium]